MGKEMVKEHSLSRMEKNMKGEVDGWKTLEWNTIRQKGKHLIQNCEWNIDKTMTTYKTNTHQKHQQLKSPLLVKQTD